LIGLLLFVRKQGLGIAILGPAVLSIFIIRGTFRRFTFLFMTCVGIFVMSIYSLYAYHETYRVLSFVPPYNFSGFIYSTFFQTKPHAELLLMDQDFEPIYYELGADWHQAPISERKSVNEKYLGLFRKKFAKDLPLFLHHYARNMIWIWDRDHLFYYRDLWYPLDRWPVRFVNIFYLGLFGVGFFGFIKSRWQTILQNPLVLVTSLTFGLITLTFTLVSNEVRHSLVFMSFLALWAGNGAVVLVKTFGLFHHFHAVQSVHTK
jgi:hypothetical protein